MARYIIITLITLLALSSTSYAQAYQNYWRVKIIDKATRINLETASISINRNKFYPINENGVAEILLSEIKLTDSIHISCLGFETTSLVVDDILGLPKVVDLKQATFELNEVIIDKKNEYLEKEVGIDAFSLTSILTAYEYKYALFIPNNENQEGYIQDILIHMKNSTSSIKEPFKLCLYEKDERTKLPGKEIIDGIITQNLTGKNWYDINLGYLAIKLPKNGFFISFETLPSSYYRAKTKKIHGKSFQRVPSLAGTTNPKKYSKDYYSLTWYPSVKKWIISPDLELQMKAKLLVLKD